MQSVLATPIRIWDEPPLILTLEHERPGHFGENRRELAVAIAAQIFEAQTLFRRQAQHYVEEFELKGLLGASEKLSAAAHVVDLLRHIVDYARGVGKFDTCAVCLLSEGTRSFLRRCYGRLPKGDSRKVFPSRVVELGELGIACSRGVFGDTHGEAFGNADSGS